MLLIGPPGVGKTSLGESVAAALGRRFVRVALGGVRDEAEVRGHRRTYVGARPGRIVRALIETESMNPVFLLDEMDKVGADWRGDPSSALLEVLDPAQNHTFRDHYLESDLDLSDVMFIATANVLDTIPAPLLDRTEVIRLDGYTDREKVTIAEEHLLPRQIEQSGLRPEEIEVTDEALATIVDGYTREAGVRGLERQLGKLIRKVVTQVASDPEAVPVAVESDDLKELLGKPPIHRDEAADRTSLPGVATGLAVTGAGGDVLFIEATVMDGEPGLTLTGQLGDVMKESAQIALSYVRSHADELGIDAEQLNRRFHLHVPAGAIPKDGPSAGITMTTALVSLLTGRNVKETVGMTGEVTLQGRVLPIGGVKQKVLAAHRAGLAHVVIPSATPMTWTTSQTRSERTWSSPSWATSARSSIWHWSPWLSRAEAPTHIEGGPVTGPLHDVAGERLGVVSVLVVPLFFDLDSQLAVFILGGELRLVILAAELNFDLVGAVVLDLHREPGVGAGTVEEHLAGAVANPDPAADHLTGFDGHLRWRGCCCGGRWRSSGRCSRRRRGSGRCRRRALDHGRRCGCGRFGRTGR